MIFSRKSLLVLLSTGLLLGCSPVEKKSFNDTGGSTEEGSTSPSVEGEPLYLVLQSKYETASETSVLTEGTCAANSTTPAATCTIRIPELRLYYSELRFTVGTTSSAGCSHVSFMPYNFRRATASTNFYGSSTATDCTDSTKKECWGGAAKNILENAGVDFPANSGVYFLPSQQLQGSYKLNSSNSRRSDDDKDESLFTNVNAANNLLVADRGNVFANTNGVYYSGTYYRDYTISCRDDYGHAMYSITLTIEDMDTPTAEGVEDLFYDWN